MDNTNRSRITNGLRDIEVDGEKGALKMQDQKMEDRKM